MKPGNSYRSRIRQRTGDDIVGTERSAVSAGTFLAQLPTTRMLNIWMLAGGTLAAAVIALGVRLLRDRRDPIEPNSVQPVSDEWLAHARGTKEHDW